MEKREVALIKVQMKKFDTVYLGFDLQRELIMETWRDNYNRQHIQVKIKRKEATL